MNVTRGTFKRFKATYCYFSQIKRNKLWTKFTNTTKVEYHVLSTVTDRSDLSDEVAFMCAKLPIYRVKKTTPFSVMVRRKCYHLLLIIGNYRMCVNDSKVTFT